MGRRRTIAEAIEQAAPPGFDGLHVTAEGLRLAHFSRSLLRGTVGQHAGEPFELEPWEILIASELLRGRVERQPVYGEGLVGLARGNGKTGFGAVLSLEGLIVEGLVDPGTEVFCAASTTKQARILFDDVRKMREASPLLMDWTKAYRDAIEVPETGAVFRVLAGDRAAEAAHGLRPSRVIVDEVHAHKNPELYYALRTAMHKRWPFSLLVGITTAGFDLATICGELYVKGKDGSDPRFFFHWLELTDEEVAEIMDLSRRIGTASPGVKARLLRRIGEITKRVNPASFVTAEMLTELYQGVPFGVFLRLHGNRWTRTEELWLPPGAWDACQGTLKIEEGAPCWAGIDPGFKHDTCGTIEVVPVYERDDGLPNYHVRARAFGVRPADPRKPVPPVHHFAAGDEVDYDLVENHVEDIAKRQRLMEASYDPVRFWRNAQTLLGRGVNMVEFPQTNERMVPASQTLFDIVTERRLVHDGDPHLRAQIENAVARDTGRGWRLDKKKSKAAMDLAVALAMPLARAVEHEMQAPAKATVVVGPTRLPTTRRGRHGAIGL